MNATTRLPSIIAVLLSIVLIGAGAVMLIQGLEARRDVRAALVSEQIVTADDAAIPGVAVDSAATARAQADIIAEHALNLTDGRTFAQMERDDPLRPTYLQAVTLRTSLMTAYMAYKLADLVIGLGALFLLLGIGGGAASALTVRDAAAKTVPAASVVPQQPVRVSA